MAKQTHNVVVSDSANTAAVKTKAVPVPEAPKPKLTVGEMLVVICRAFTCATEKMNANCLSAMNENVGDAEDVIWRFSFATYTVCRKASSAIAKNRPDVTVRATVGGERLGIAGTIGNTTVSLTGFGIPRELATSVFKVPAREIENVYAVANDSLFSE